MNIKGYKLTDEIVIEIGRFAILWNCFERGFFNNKCCPKKINEIYKNPFYQQRCAGEISKCAE